MRRVKIVAALFLAAALAFVVTPVTANAPKPNPSGFVLFMTFEANGETLKLPVELASSPGRLNATDGRIYTKYSAKDVASMMSALASPAAQDFFIRNNIDPDEILANQLFGFVSPKSLVPRKPESGRISDAAGTCLRLTMSPNGVPEHTVVINGLSEPGTHVLDDTGALPVRRMMWSPADATRIIKALRNDGYEAEIPTILTGLTLGKVKKAPVVDSGGGIGVNALSGLREIEPKDPILKPDCGECLAGGTCRQSYDCCQVGTTGCTVCNFCRRSD